MTLREVEAGSVQVRARFNGKARSEVSLLNRATGIAVHIDTIQIANARDRARFTAALPEALREDAEQALQALALQAPASEERAPAATAGQGQPLEREVIAPWPDPVDGAALLDETAAMLRRFVSMSGDDAVAVTLWVFHTHAIEACYHTPNLAITAPEKQCGKSTCLTVVGRLCPQPIMAANITPSALFRTVDMQAPRLTLLLDEVETYLRGDNNEEMRGILNAGHNRETAFVIRNVGDDHMPAKFSTFCPKAMTCIGSLPSTLADRSIPIQLQRRTRADAGAKWRPHLQPAIVAQCDAIRRKATRWVADHLEALRDATPAPVDCLTEREADNWHTLLAIADAAGGAWPARARAAAAQLASPDDGRLSVRVDLLHDIRDYIETHAGADSVESATLAKHLGELDDRRWPEWSHGRPISARGVAVLLNPFGIKPGKLNSADRGYRLDAFADAFARYLPPVERRPAVEFPLAKVEIPLALPPNGTPNTLPSQAVSSQFPLKTAFSGGEGGHTTKGRPCTVPGCTQVTKRTPRGVYRCPVCCPTAFPGQADGSAA